MVWAVYRFSHVIAPALCNCHWPHKAPAQSHHLCAGIVFPGWFCLYVHYFITLLFCEFLFPFSSLAVKMMLGSISRPGLDLDQTSLLQLALTPWQIWLPGNERLYSFQGFLPIDLISTSSNLLSRDPRNRISRCAIIVFSRIALACNIGLIRPPFTCDCGSNVDAFGSTTTRAS